MTTPANDNARLLSRAEAVNDNDPREACSFVYVIFSHAQNAFKVGYTANKTSRLPSIQTGNPDTLTLGREIRAGKECERALIEALSKYHIRGEWFRETELGDFLIDDLLDQEAGADQCGRLMNASEAREAAKSAIRYFEVGQFAHAEAA